MQSTGIKNIQSSQTQITYEISIESLDNKIVLQLKQLEYISDIFGSVFVEVNPKFSEQKIEYLSIRLRMRRLHDWGLNITKKENINFVKFMVGIIDGNAKIVNQLSSPFLECITSETRFCWKRFIKREDLVNLKNDLIHENILKIWCQIILSDENHTNSDELIAQNLEKCYNSLLDDKELSDFTVEVDSKQFFVHKAVLAARSPVFRAMICSDMKEKKEAKVVLHDIGVEVFEQLLSFIYTGKSPNIEKYARSLIIAADFYDIPELRITCGLTLFRELTQENVWEAIKFAEKYGLQDIKLRGIDFIANNRKNLKNHLMDQ